MILFSINGLGLRLIGAKKAEETGVYFGTVWFTLLFFPVFPLYRLKLKPESWKQGKFSFQQISKTPLIAKEIITTYLYGILIPVIGIGPLILPIKEVSNMINIPNTLQTPLMIIAIIWLIVFVWKLKDWDEKRWFK